MTTIKITHPADKVVRVGDCIPINETFRWRVLYTNVLRHDRQLGIVETQCECEVVGEIGF